MTKVPLRTLAVSLLTLGALSGSISVAGGGAGATTQGPVRLVIGYRSGASSSVVQGVDHAYGLHQVGSIGSLHAQVVTVGSAGLATRLSKLRHHSTVAYAQVDSVATPQSTPVTPNDPYFAGGISGQEWGEVADQVDDAWGVTTGSSSVTIAIIDSGVDPTQPDLKPVLVPGWNVLTGTSNTTDKFGHGTKVAGVAVAATNNAVGVAGYCWTCRLMPIEVYDTGAGAYESNLASGITWAVNHGANVVNISLAGPSDTTVLNAAVAYALSHNVTVVAAAGDSGNTGNPKEYPAAIPGVISVAAYQQNDTLSSYSESGSWVDVAAPNSQATTLATGRYAFVGGTSISAPAVAGIVGLMLSVDPSASPTQIGAALFSTTAPVIDTPQVAYGRVNAYAALTAVETEPPPAATAPVSSSPPTITGSDQEGQTLHASQGTWSGKPNSYDYQWSRCSPTVCTLVSGAASPTYSLGGADVGSQLRVTVVAANSAGSATATSALTATVSAPVSASATTKHKKK